MATAREVRAAVRAQLAEQMAARQDAALSVASAWSKVEKARERLAAAERETSAAVATATEHLSLADLSRFSGVPATELRRLARGGKASEPTEPASQTIAEPTPPVPVSEDGTEPSAAAGS